MASKNELIEIRMKLLGAREVAEGTGVAQKGIKGVGTAASRTTRETTKAHKATSVLSKGYGQLGRAARYGLGFIGVGGVFALEKAVENTAELSKVTTGLNRNLGLSVKVGSEWAAVAHARGIASTALNMGFTKLGRSFVEANRKGGTARTALNQLGITQAQTEKGAHNFAYALDLVSKKFGKAEAGPRRQSAAMSLLGKGYSTVLPLFAQGNKGLQEQLHWADKYGVTLDGKTNNALMEMVNAQRESKVAMLGLQVAMTKALMPAIDAGEGQLQKFIATLNDPKLTTTQKIVRIEKQFEDLEEFLLKAIASALPKVAEQGGQLGVKLAEAVWTGFRHSDLAGKLVIGAWLFKFLGGFSLIGRLGARVGAKLATALGWKFLETVAPYFAAEAGVEGLGSALGSQMGGLKTLFGSKGKILGSAMGVAAAGALIAEIVFAVENSEEIAGLSLFNTPKADASSREEEATHLESLGYKVLDFPANPNLLNVVSPTGKHERVRAGKRGGWTLDSERQARHQQHRRQQHQGRPRANIERRIDWRGLPPIHVHTYIDGREVALSVARHAGNAAALA
jgi:hypothetical protein